MACTKAYTPRLHNPLHYPWETTLNQPEDGFPHYEHQFVIIGHMTEQETDTKLAATVGVPKICSNNV